MDFKYTDYPELFTVTDSHSLKGQESYLFWIRLELILLIFATIISMFPLVDGVVGQRVAIFSAVVFAMGIGLTLYIKNVH